MTLPARTSRSLGTMVAYGFAGGDVGVDLAIATRIGAVELEILPEWRAWPDAGSLRTRVADLGLAVHSAHGCWGGQSIRANRVDLGEPNPIVRSASVDDLKRCIDWVMMAGGRCAVVHPGGLSDQERFAERRAALADSLIELADHAVGSGVVVCVENMPPGVHPGSRMADLTELVAELGRAEIALALDTGHANITSAAADETRAAGSLLRTTHVHDNDGRQDSHEPPGLGTVDWDAWLAALDEVGYTGPVMLECIRHLRHHPEVIDEAFLGQLRRLSGVR